MLTGAAESPGQRTVRFRGIGHFSLLNMRVRGISEERLFALPKGTLIQIMNVRTIKARLREWAGAGQLWRASCTAETVDRREQAGHWTYCH